MLHTVNAWNYTEYNDELCERREIKKKECVRERGRACARVHDQICSASCAVNSYMVKTRFFFYFFRILIDLQAIKGNDPIRPYVEWFVMEDGYIYI